jgi:hypothetical protein
MLRVWVFPLITLILGILDDLARTLRFLGAGCRLEDDCFHQIGTTVPFYSAISYATGAWLALRFSIRSRLSSRIVNVAAIWGRLF